jgi:putative chitinase
VRQFQAAHRLEVDGDVGSKTRAALVALVPGEAEKPEVKAAPVTEEKTVVEEKPVAVTPPNLDALSWRSKEILVPAAGGGIATTLNALGGIP